MGAFLSDPLLTACGANGPLRLELNWPGGSGVSTYASPWPFVVVGRDASVDLVLDHPDVSRRHAYLQMIGGRVFCVDLRSRAGTYWEEKPRPMGWVDRERGIRIGPYRIVALAETPEGDSSDATSQEEMPTTSQLSGPSGLPRAVLGYLGPWDERPEWRRMEGALSFLGKARLCDFRLKGTDVSMFHCSLVRTPEGVWAVDLLSGGGIRVNGMPVRQARLSEGDELRVGGYRIGIRYETPSPTPPTHAPLGIAGPAPASMTGPAILAPDALILSGPGGGWSQAVPQDLSDPALATMFQELGRMQQQMSDHFQQALLMMVKMFGEMHREQSAVIREELARIARLTEEQRTLQSELSGRIPAPADQIRLDEPRANRPELPPDVPTGAKAATGAGRDPSRASPRPGLGGTRLATSAPREPSRRADPPVDPHADGEIHALLVQRIVALQGERQGRWRRLINSVTGKGSGH